MAISELGEPSLEGKDSKQSSPANRPTSTKDRYMIGKHNKLKSLKVAQKHGCVGDDVHVIVCVGVYGDVVCDVLL